MVLLCNRGRKIMSCLKMPCGSRDSWGSRCVEVCEIGRYALGWYSKFDVKQIIIKEKLVLPSVST